LSDQKDEMLIALQRIEQRLMSVERWLRFASMGKLREILLGELKEDRKKLVYELSDGTRGYREVGQVAKVPGPTVQGWWSRWFTMGIMEPSPNRSGRVQRICSLREIGIDVAQAPLVSSTPKSKSKNLPDQFPQDFTSGEESENGDRESR
jgi:hypothetical protein